MAGVGLCLNGKKRKNPPEIREQYNIKKEAISDLNVNDIFSKYNVPENVDFVSIDIDGQDYYVWQALKWSPKVILIEFNEGLGPDDNKVMQLDREHWTHRDKTYYYGASIRALKKSWIGKRIYIVM